MPKHAGLKRGSREGSRAQRTGRGSGLRARVLRKAGSTIEGLKSWKLEDAKAQLLRLVSHELRTPLHHIKGFASTLLQPDLEWDAATQRECLEAIEQGADRLARLIDALLDMARVADGRFQPRRQPCAPAALVTAAVEIARDAHAEHEVQVAVSPTLSEVLVDPVHEDWWSRAATLIPPASAEDSERLQSFRRFMTEEVNDPTRTPEGIDIPASAAQVQATGSLGKLPLIVVKAGIQDILAPGLPPDLEAALTQLLQTDLPEELAGLSTLSIKLDVPDSGHDIPQMQPDAVVVAIRTMIDVSRLPSR